MTAKNRLTIIVPVYNTPVPLMEVFFDSLRNQSIQDFDVIVVDDGSEKECKEYLKWISSERMNVRVIFNGHQGVSHTRNTGILNAGTEYLAFADSDDVLDERFVESAIGYIREYGADFFCGTIEYVPDNGGIRQNDGHVGLFEKEGLIEIKKALLNIIPRKLEYQILGAPVAKLYRTTLAKKTLFDEDLLIYEDQIFNRKMIDHASSAAVIPDIWYRYIQRDASSLHRSFKKGFYHALVPYLQRSFEMDQNECNDLRNGIRMNYIRILYAAINLDLLANDLPYSEMKTSVREMIGNETIEEAIRNIDTSDLGSVDRLNVKLLRNGNIVPLLMEKKLLYAIRKTGLLKR